MTAEQCYLRLYPDVQINWVNAGIGNARSHYDQYGKGEGRLWGCYKLVLIGNSTEDQAAASYLNRYPDVRLNWPGSPRSHYDQYGKNEGRVWGNYNLISSDGYEVITTVEPVVLTNGTIVSPGGTGAADDFINGTQPAGGAGNTNQDVNTGIIDPSGNVVNTGTTPNTKTNDMLIGGLFLLLLAAGGIWGYRKYKASKAS